MQSRSERAIFEKIALLLCSSNFHLVLFPLHALSHASPNTPNDDRGDLRKMLHHTASRNGGSTAPTPPSSARHAPASSPFGAATAAVHASAAGAESSVDRTPPRNPPPSARRPWRVPQQLASVAPAAASLYRQLTSGRWGSGGDGAGGLASWAAFGSSSSSPLHRGGRRSGGGQVFRAVGNSRVARAVRANKRVTAAGLAALAVIVLVSSSSGGFAGRARTRYSRSLVADSDNSSELDAVTLSELTALDAKQGGVGAVAGKAANNNNSPPRRASPTAADLPGTATATPTGLAIEALDRSELSGLVQSTGFFSANEAEAVVDAVSKGDLDTAELLKAIEGEMVKQAQEAERAKAAVQAAEDASKAPATKGKDGGGGIGSAGTADDIDEWFFDDLGDDDFFFDDEDGVGDGGRDEGFGDYFDDEDDDLFGFDDEDEFSSPRGSGGGSGARKGAAGGGRRAGGRASSDSSRATSPRGAATSPRRGGNVLDDDVHDGLGLGTSSSSSRVGSRSRSSGRGSSRPVDLNEDELEEDARLFGDDEGFGDELDDAADAPPRRGGGRQFAEVSRVVFSGSRLKKGKKWGMGKSHPFFFRFDFFNYPTGRICRRRRARSPRRRRRSQGVTCDEEVFLFSRRSQRRRPSRPRSRRRLCRCRGRQHRRRRPLRR